MRNQSYALLAALLLSLGAPAAQARYGGSLLGSASHDGGGGSVYTPPPGSPERQALMDAIRRKVGKTSGKYVVFIVRHVKVSRGWAWAVVKPQSPGGRTSYDQIAALLHKRGGQWTVSHILDGDAGTTDPDTLRDKYPYAPPGIF